MNKQFNFDRAKRLNMIEPFHVMRLLEKAKNMEERGVDIIHMEVGEPDFPTPDSILKAGQAALTHQKTFYTPAVGLMELREAISQYYEDCYQIDVSPHRIIITPGASGALLLVCSLLVNTNQTLMMTDPGYPCNRHFLRLLGADAQLIPVDASQNFQISAQDVHLQWRQETAGVLLASPANPTGAVLTEEQLTEITRTVKQKKGFVIVDEIYHGLQYGEPSPPALSIDDSIIVINSFSKYFQMTGWRLGWLILPESLISEADKLSQNLFLSPSSIAQHAALAAFDAETLETLEERRSVFKVRRDYLFSGLNALGLNVQGNPAGAFYLYAESKSFSDDSLRFVESLLDEEGIAIAPGIDFGNFRAESHVRFSYTAPIETLEIALDRLSRFLKKVRV